MSRIMKIFVNMKNSFFSAGRRATYVGSDHFGNKYFEKVADGRHELRGSRYIGERKELGPHDSPEIPVEWEAWLRGRRMNPPTEEEIKKNYQRMMQKKLRAQELENKYLEGTQVSSESTQISEFTEDITTNTQKANFPSYEEYESAPGKKFKSSES